jgi:hypothetical protein
LLFKAVDVIVPVGTSIVTNLTASASMPRSQVRVRG